MSPAKLRLLADCLRSGFMGREDAFAWAKDLEGFAKSLERSVVTEQPAAKEYTPSPGFLKRHEDRIETDSRDWPEWMKRQAKTWQKQKLGLSLDPPLVHNWHVAHSFNYTDGQTRSYTMYCHKCKSSISVPISINLVKFCVDSALRKIRRMADEHSPKTCEGIKAGTYTLKNYGTTSKITSLP